MKQSDITPESIKLSKQIAEFWRMEIYEGCWVSKKVRKLVTKDEKIICKEIWKTRLYNGRTTIIKEGECFPIPSISDVLTRLQELDYILSIWQRGDKMFAVTASRPMGMGRSKTSESLYVALLQSLLSVLKGKTK